MAAVLAAGPGAVLSHRSAAALWELLNDGRRGVDVTVGRGKARRRPGIEIHSAVLADGDLTVREGLPCTTLPRTLLDLAATADRRLLERAIGRAEELRAFDLGEIRELLARSPGQRGTRALATAIAELPEAGGTRSEAEERFLALVRRAGLPVPEVNVWIPLPEGGGYRPDFLWRDRMLIAAVDGRSHHSLRRAFEHDRRRDRRLLREGYVTVRFPARQVLEEPARAGDELRSLLGPTPSR